MGKLIRAWNLRDGDVFTYGADQYKALANPQGEHSTRIMVQRLSPGPHRGSVTEILIPDQNVVAIDVPAELS